MYFERFQSGRKDKANKKRLLRSNEMCKIGICFAGMVILTGGCLSAAIAEEIEMIVLTDTRQEDDVPSEIKEFIANDKRYQAMFKRRAANQKRHAKILRRIMTDMDRDGFAVVNETHVSTYDTLVSDIKQLTRPGPVTLGYRGADLNKPAFKRGRKVAEQAIFEDDGITHNMMYVFEFDDIGFVVIDELSYTTIPDTKIIVNKPTGNLTINGYPATYTALTNKSGKKGLSGITYITESKLISVTALKCITRKDEKEFARFVEIAAAVL